jgi:hypothetical protein
MTSNFIVLSKKEGEEAYRDLVRGKRPLQVAIKGQLVKQGTAAERESGDLFFNLPFVQRFEGTFEAVVSFSLPPEVFFLNTQVTNSNGKYFFKEVEEVFKLQRRDSFRLNLAEVGNSEICFVGGDKFQIHDISQGGFSIELKIEDAKTFSDDKQILGDISILGETFSNVLCEVKHTRIIPTDRSKVLVGFQFLKLGAEREEELFRLITDIARKHFR